MEELSTESLRESWRSINGLGASSVDSILLFALGRSVYPVDPASYRVFVRHGWVEPGVGYEEASETMARLSPDDAGRLGRLALALKSLGKTYCKPGSPRCDSCPLRGLLPPSGPVEEC